MNTLLVLGVALGAVAVIVLHDARSTVNAIDGAGESTVPLMPKRTFLQVGASVCNDCGDPCVANPRRIDEPQPDFLILAAWSPLLLAISFFTLKRQYKDDPDEVL